MPSKALDSILCLRFTLCTGFSLIIPGKILLRYVGQRFSKILNTIFTPQPLKAVRVLFSPMVSGWMGGGEKKFDEVEKIY